MTPSLPALAQGGTGSPLGWSYWVMVGTLILIWWFVVIRHQRKEERKRRDLIAAIKVGDRVVTSGGMIGTVDRIDDRTVRLRVADGVRVDFLRSALAGLHQDGAGEAKG